MTDWEMAKAIGKEQERRAILEYIEYHPEATLQDIVDEIEGRCRQDDRERLKNATA